MTDAIESFFHQLAERGHEPLLKHVSGKLSCELVDGGRVERWLLIIKRGSVAVARDGRAADCMIRTDRETFARLITGQLNATVALLCGEVLIEGNTELLAAVERILPGPPAGAGLPAGRGG